MSKKYFSNIIHNQYGKTSLIFFVFQEHVKTLTETIMWRKVAKWSIGKAEQQKTKLLELNGTLTVWDLMGITFNSIQPMNRKHMNI